MYSCSYCGRRGTPTDAFCTGCGQPVEPDRPKKADAYQTSRSFASAGLNAASVTLVLLSYVIANVLSGWGIAALGLAAGSLHGEAGPDLVAKVHRAFVLLTGTLTPLLAGFVALIVALRMARGDLSETGPCGPALAAGSLRGLLCGFLTGAAVASATYSVARAAHFHAAHRSVSDFDKLAAGPTFSALAWIINGVLIAPLVEEVLLRGILYGGYRKSWGRTAAALLTTTIYLALHMPATLQYLPTMVALSVLSAGAIWFRLQFRAVGPAILLHAGYNAFITLLRLLPR